LNKIVNGFSINSVSLLTMEIIDKIDVLYYASSYYRLWNKGKHNFEKEFRAFALPPQTGPVSELVL